MAKTEWELFRAIHRSSPDCSRLDDLDAGKNGASSDGLLHARIQGAVQMGSDGRQFVEGADLTRERTGEDGPWYVLADGGTSMHDVPGWFGYAEWSYFNVPKGTEYCDDVLFFKPDKNQKWNRSKTVKGRHYTVRPKTRMTLDAYFGALDNLARAAIARSVALGKPVKVR